VAVNPGDLAGALGNVAQLGHALERTQDDVPIKDATTLNPYTDRKVFTKEREKKIALGHKADDHEDKQNWQQTM
jgi:hypothetical protein